jgi:hypothetical protein
MAEGRRSLVIYPGERINGSGYVVGHIYVNDGIEKYEVAGGPATQRPIPDAGGHTATKTPPGRYTLDKPEHHTTVGWPNSVVPWGAKIREVNDVVQFELGGRWVDASGPKGKVTDAAILFAHNSKRPVSRAVASRYARQIFYTVDGKLVSQWFQNDFGPLAWNLTQNGKRTVYFIHTTRDEAAGASPFDLEQSHGCLHIRPKDRDRMIDKGYLAQGVTVIVKKYEDRWLPPHLH